MTMEIEALAKEVSELQAELDQRETAFQALRRDHESALLQLSELIEDRERLNWAEINMPNILFVCEFDDPNSEKVTGVHAEVAHKGGETTAKTLRAAIDAAMGKTGEEPNTSLKFSIGDKVRIKKDSLPVLVSACIHEDYAKPLLGLESAVREVDGDYVRLTSQAMTDGSICPASEWNIPVEALEAIQ